MAFKLLQITNFGLVVDIPLSFAVIIGAAELCALIFILLQVAYMYSSVTQASLKKSVW